MATSWILGGSSWRTLRKKMSAPRVGSSLCTLTGSRLAMNLVKIASVLASSRGKPYFMTLHHMVILYDKSQIVPQGSLLRQTLPCSTVIYMQCTVCWYVWSVQSLSNNGRGHCDCFSLLPRPCSTWPKWKIQVKWKFFIFLPKIPQVF